jgi:hypothetical protein
MVHGVVALGYKDILFSMVSLVLIGVRKLSPTTHSSGQADLFILASPRQMSLSRAIHLLSFQVTGQPFRLFVENTSQVVESIEIWWAANHEMHSSLTSLALACSTHKLLEYPFIN